MNKTETIKNVMESIMGRDISTKEHRSVAKELVRIKDVEWLLAFVDSAITSRATGPLKVACWALPHCEANGVDGIWKRFLKIAESDRWEVREEASHCFRLMLRNGNTDYIKLVDSQLSRLTIFQLRAVTIGFVRYISERYTIERKVLRRIVDCCLSTNDMKLQQLVAKFAIGDYLYYCLPQEALRFTESWANDKSVPQRMRLAAESVDAATASQFSPLFLQILSDLMKSDDSSIKRIAARSAKRHFVNAYGDSIQSSSERVKSSSISSNKNSNGLIQSLPNPNWLSATYGDGIVAKLCQIAGEVDTPFTVIFAGLMARQIRALKYLLPEEFSVRYGGKAWFHPWLLYEIRTCGLHLCASSKEEVQSALLLGFDPKMIHFMQTGCKESDIIEVQKNGVNIIIDSKIQADILCETIAPPKNCNIGLRLSLEYIPSSHEAIVRPPSSLRFGITLNEVPHVVEKLTKHGYRVSEVVGHAGSLIWKSSAFLSVVKELARTAPYLADPIALNIGGGLPFCYVNECPLIDITELGNLLSAERSIIQRSLRRKVGIVLEPSRLLSAPCAIQVSLITDAKQRTNDSKFLFCDAVLNSLELSLPVSVLRTTGDKERWSKDILVSNLCAPEGSISDHIGEGAIVGDLIAIGGTGGYVIPLTNNLQSRRKPSEVVLHPSGSWSVVRRPIPELSWFKYVQ